MRIVLTQNPTEQFRSVKINLARWSDMIPSLIVTPFGKDVQFFHPAKLGTAPQYAWHQMD